MTSTPSRSNVQSLRPRDHDNGVRVAVSWLGERHRKGWQNAFKNLLSDWRPDAAQDDWHLDADAMYMLSVNAGEWLLARGQIHARGSLRKINSYLLSPEGPYLTAQRWCRDHGIAPRWTGRWATPTP